MSKKGKKYERLPGKKKNFLIGYYTLWLGADHLLLIYSRFGFEDYKRFYFPDIQSIITQKTTGGKVQNVILGSLLGFSSLMIIFTDGVWALFNGIMAGCSFLLLMVNWLRGPTCVTWLQTAVQTEKLPSLHRLKKAQRVMARLKPLIENVQGPLNPQALNLEPPKVQKPSPPSIRSALSQPVDTKITRHDNGIAHLILFALILLDGLVIILNAYFQQTVLTLLSTTASMGAGICVIVALVKQHDSDIQKALRIITWTTLGYICMSLILGYAMSLVLAFQHPELRGNQWKLIELVAEMSMFENPLMASINLLSIGGAFGLGLPGMILIDRHHKAFKATGAAPVIPKGVSIIARRNS